MQSVVRLFPKNLPSAVGPYSPVTMVGDIVFVSGQIPINPESNKI
jgi:2-iminobutanoate/2-iminopropanoate deaminase